MNFLKTLFWVTLAVVAVIFASNNWSYVPINLWGGLQPLVRLPLLLLVTFLIGFLPMYAVHSATRWRLRRKLEASERAVADLRPAVPVTPEEMTDPVAPTATPAPPPPPPSFA